MTLIPQTCPNCGAPVRVEKNAHTECRYCHSPLYFPDSAKGQSEQKKATKESSVKSTTVDKQKRSRSSKGAPIPFIVLWVGVCIYIATRVGGSSAYIPIGMGVFGAYMMISDRKRKKRR